jgi:alkylation response protein AidB-like acyl-CoA dehydrogenase
VGSDLSALECRADREGDDYIVTGKKIWTSGAHIADWCWLAVRTNAHVPKHKGISLLLVDMKSPGITIRPLKNMAGFSQLNEVTFEQVRVPRENLVGEENKGWYYVVQALDFERSSTRDLARIKRLLDELINYVKTTQKDGKPLAQDPLIRQKIARLATDLRVAQLLDWRVGWMQSKGLIPNYEASMAKVACSELALRAAHTGMQILGLSSQFDKDGPWAKIRGWITHVCLYNVHQPISRGTNEIQRNIIAQRGLGLPRG